MDNIDLQLRQSYRLPGRIPDIVLERGKTALLIIDLQYLDAHREGEYAKRAREHGIEDTIEHYFARIENLVIPNTRRLLDACRREKIDVIFTRIAALTENGRDLGWRYKEWKLLSGVDSLDAQFLPGIKPQRDEIVINKTATSAFIGSHIDRLLRNMGMQYLIVCGVVTNGCVESSVRDAADLGYRVLLAEDGCAALSQQAHDNAINAMNPIHAIVMCTDEILTKIEHEIRSP